MFSRDDDGVPGVDELDEGVLSCALDDLVHEAAVDERIVDGLEDEEGDGVERVGKGSAPQDVDGGRRGVELMEEVTRDILPPLVGHVDVEVDSVVRQGRDHSTYDRKDEHVADGVQHKLGRESGITA